MGLKQQTNSSITLLPAHDATLFVPKTNTREHRTQGRIRLLARRPDMAASYTVSYFSFTFLLSPYSI
jgi:hypothetical protein